MADKAIFSASYAGAGYDAAAYAADAASKAEDNVAEFAADAAADAADAAAAAANDFGGWDDFWESVNYDLELMREHAASDIVERMLWGQFRFVEGRSFTFDAKTRVWRGPAWSGFRKSLFDYEPHWQIWIDWYEDILNGHPPWGLPREAGNAVSLEFLTWPEEKWEREPEEVNQEIAALIEAERTKLTAEDVPDQQIAPVRVEERDGKIAKISDRDSALLAPERDFEQWRAPVASHLDELLAGDFRPGTNHARMRDRLTELQAHLHGSTADVKENQFKLGYAMTRFASLISAYETGGDDMPVLSPDTLKDLIVLDAGLRMGLDKLERWVAFREAAANDRSGASDAPAGEVAKVLDSIAGNMEGESKYFDAELPRTFRLLAEAAKDPYGATRTVVYGAVRSAENVFIFVGQIALGLAAGTADGAKTGISKAVAAGLFVFLSGLGLHLAGIAPGALSWIKPVLEAIQKIAL
jgi:hypothetical protein